MSRRICLVAAAALSFHAAAFAAPAANNGVRAISTMAMCDSPSLDAPGFPGWAHMIPCFGNR